LPSIKTAQEALRPELYEFGTCTAFQNERNFKQNENNHLIIFFFELSRVHIHIRTSRLEKTELRWKFILNYKG